MKNTLILSSSFEMFSLTHLIVFLICALLLLIFYKYAPKLKTFKYEKYVRISIGIFMLIFELLTWINKFSEGYPWYNFLPQATCGWAIYFGVILLLTKNETIFRIIFFWGFGAVLTFVFPDVTEGPNTFRFYQFFISHFFIFISCYYMMWVHDFKIYRKDFKFSFIITMSVIFIATIVNYIVNDPNIINYFYTLAPPTDGTPLDLIYGLHPIIYVVGWLSLATLLTHLYALPFYTKK